MKKPWESKNELEPSDAEREARNKMDDIEWRAVQRGSLAYPPAAQFLSSELIGADTLPDAAHGALFARILIAEAALSRSIARQRFEVTSARQQLEHRAARIRQAVGWDPGSAPDRVSLDEEHNDLAEHLARQTQVLEILEADLRLAEEAGYLIRARAGRRSEVSEAVVKCPTSANEIDPKRDSSEVGPEPEERLSGAWPSGRKGSA